MKEEIIIKKYMHAVHFTEAKANKRVTHGTHI